MQVRCSRRLYRFFLADFPEPRGSDGSRMTFAVIGFIAATLLRAQSYRCVEAREQSFPSRLHAGLRMSVVEEMLLGSTGRFLWIQFHNPSIEPLQPSGEIIRFHCSRRGTEIGFMGCRFAASGGPY